MAVYPHLSDLELVLRDPIGQTRTLPVHRVVLAMNSEFFQSMLTGSFRESHQHQIVVEVPDIDKAVKLIKWFYTRTPIISIETIELAEQWLVRGVFITPTIKCPGKTGTFVRCIEQFPSEWELKNWPKVKFWEIMFKATSAESMIHNLHLRMDTGGYVQVGIKFEGLRSLEFNAKSDGIDRATYEKTLDTLNQFTEYLKQYGLQLNYSHRYEGEYYPNSGISEQYRDPVLNRRLIQLVLQNNTFDPKDVEFLQTLWTSA